MRATVNLTKCNSSGECVQTLPQVFQFQPGHKKAAVGVDPIPKVYEQGCRQAAQACPGDAIVIEEKHAGEQYMDPSSGAQNTAEVVKQQGEEQIDLKVVRWFAGESRPSNEERRLLGRLRSERGEDFYSDLISALLGCRYPCSESRQIWDAIVSHRDVMTCALNRTPGIVMATLDWVRNMQPGNPIDLRLIENDRLEGMMEYAKVDELTGLYDHDTLRYMLHNEIERAKRHFLKVSLLLLVFDNFEQVNDHLGRRKGDEALVRLAETVCASTRLMDIAGRYSDVELAVMLPDTGPIGAAKSAERIRKAVEAQFHQDIELTISMGVACFPDDADQVQTLVEAADKALL